MMMKSFLIIFSLIFILTNEIDSLKDDEYLSSIEDLLLNPEFLYEYNKWSLKLFSDPDYRYGKSPGAFPCPLSVGEPRNDPITIHNLRPGDVQCVGAIGDSLTAGLGAQATTPIGLVTEWRGISWSIGGDGSYDQVLTLPNILRQYNPNLKGYSTKTSVIFLAGQNATNNHLNVAKSSSESYNMSDQVHLIYERIRSGAYCDLNNDWKVITFFIGGNDLCLFCNDLDGYSPDNYAKRIENTLDYFHANFPRTLINLVLVLDIIYVKELNAGGLVCSLLHQKTCPCAAFPTDDDSRTLSQWVPLYQSKVVDLINSGKYDTRPDFTVVIQPFMAKTPLPMTDGKIDYSYFAPDCFHFSGKGHSRSALSLWNNMLEPVGSKRWEWHEGETIECPTQDRPFFATRLNSPTPYETIPKSI